MRPTSATSLIKAFPADVNDGNLEPHGSHYEIVRGSLLHVNR